MKSKIKPIYLIAVVFIIFGLMLFLDTFRDNIFTYYENALQDKFFQSSKVVDESIVMIAIDDESVNQLGAWPWNRKTHAKLLEILAKGKPAAIGIDVIFSERSSDQEADKSLVAAAKKAGNVVFASFGNMPESAKSGAINVESFYEPFPELKAVSSSGHINVIPDILDGVIRKSLNSFVYNNKKIDSFDLEIYKQYLKSTGKKSSFKRIPQDKWNQSYIDYVEKAKEFSPIPYYKVLNGTYDPEWFKGHIVLIGPYAVGMSDSYKTSIDKSAPMYGIEIHANILENLMHNNFKKDVPFVVNLLILVFFSLISYLGARKFNPLKSVVIAGICLGGFYFVAKLIYKNGYMLSLFYPTAVIVVTYLVLLAYNFIREQLEKRRITNIFGRYVAPQVVNQILKGGEESLKLGGSRKEISVLFVDIRGFTPMSEKAQPEEVVEILNDYLDLCAQAIFKFEGTLDKFIGDATMAIFNAPLDLENHALKAVQTAWAMKEGSVVLQEKLEKKFGRSVQFGIGVNTGPAVVGNIGSKTRMDYTAIGDTVNTSARLEANAKPGQILLSQATYDLVKEHVEVISLGEIKVKGKTQGIPIYQLEGVISVGEKNEKK